MISTPIAWILFSVFVAGALAVDLFFFHRRSHTVKMKEALLGSFFWISLAFLFNLGIYLYRGHQPALEFLAGYVIELSLSVDNLFVFLLLFRYFAVPAPFQHKVLFWGILGAVVMRLAFILAGVALLERFHWAIYIFGAILIFSGIRLWRQEEGEIHPERNPVLQLARRFIPITPGYEKAAFFVTRMGRRVATPLFLVLLMVETTDLMFAVDSIPAVLAITSDPFIVFSSNIFAVLGLRSLFFSLAGVMDLFHYLHYGLSAILIFVGLKMVLGDVYHLSTPIALGVVVAILALCVLISVLNPAPKKKKVDVAAEPPDDRARRA
jgi:tellurite resistance protein TerC